MDYHHSLRRLVITLFLASGLAACASPEPAAAPEITLTVGVTPSPTATVTLIPSATPEPTSTQSPTPTPTQTQTPTPEIYALETTPLPPSLEAISLANAGEVSTLAEWKLDTVNALAWSPDGKTLAVAHLDGISFYDVYTRTLTRELYPRGERVVDLAFSPQGNWLLAGSLYGSEAESWAGDLQFWSGPYWRPLGIGYADTRGLTAVEFAPKGGVFAAAFARPGSEEDVIALFSTSTWEITGTLEIEQVEEIAFSSDGTLLAVSPDRYGIQIYRMEDNLLERTLYTSFTGAVSSMAFAPDLPVLATGHYDGTLRLWDVSTGLVMLTLDTGSDSVIESLAFSPDGNLIASGDSFGDDLVRLWDTDSGELLRILEGHSAGVVETLFSPDGSLLVTGSYDGTLRLWGRRP